MLINVEVGNDNGDEYDYEEARSILSVDYWT
jgi:hypothetical protein